MEFRDKLRDRVRREPKNVDPAMLFLDFKGNRATAKAAIARYTWYLLLSIKGILCRLAALYSGRADATSLQAAQAIVALAARRIANDSFVYVEAAEEGNPRKSFDINFYKAGLTFAECRAALAATRRTWSITK